MKKLIILGAALSSITAVQAEDFYVRGNIGKTFNQDDKYTIDGNQYELSSDKINAFGIAAGAYILPEVAAEVDLRTRRNVLENKTTKTEEKIKTHSAMVNGVYQMDLGTFKPYAKAGIGMAYHKLPKDSERSFAWAVGTGVNVEVSEAVDVNLDYQYLNAGDYKHAGKKMDAANHEVTVGLKVNF